jgi:hypothetical protein
MAEKQQSAAEVLAEKQAPAFKDPERRETERERQIRESAAAQRADYVRALEEEHDMCKRAGKTDRLKAIDVELKRVKSVKDRSVEAKTEA